MNALGPSGQLVESRGRRVEQVRHLVDECSRTARAIAVHAHVGHLSFQKNHFGILAADIDESRRQRMVVSDISGCRHNLLHESDLSAFRKAQPDRAGDLQGERFIADPGARFPENLCKRFGNAGIVTTVGRKA